MSHRQTHLCLLLLFTVLLSGCCQHRWRMSERGLGFASSRGYGACVDGDDLYGVPPERIMRKESRELRQWYREMEMSGRMRYSTRYRQRGRLTGDYGFGYEGGYCEDVCGACGACGGGAGWSSGDMGSYGAEGVPVDLGYAQSFDASGGEWSAATTPMMSQQYHSHTPGSPCPVCGHAGPAYQVPPEQFVPHTPADSSTAPSIDPTPAAPPMDPGLESERAPSPPTPTAVEQTLFAPPLR